MTQALGAHALGTEPLAGDPLHDPPTVAVTGPTGTISTGGPTVTVAWSFAQAQGDTQEWFRVRALSVDLLTTYYDSGWLAGADTQWTVDVDEEGIPHNTENVTWQVDVRGPEAIGTGTVARYEASDVETVIISWGNPQATIDGPLDGAVVSSPTGLTVSWSFSDPGKTQSAYRVRLLYASSGEVVYSTGWVTSAATSVALDYILRDATEYLVEVQLKNDHGIRSS